MADNGLEMFASPRALAGVGGPVTPAEGLEESGLFRRAAAARPVTAAAHPAVDRFVVAVMSLDLLTTVLLQRIYVGVSVTLGTHVVAFSVLFLAGRLRFSAVRVVLYWLFWGGALGVEFVSGNDFSPTSLLLGVVCYATFLAVVPASQATYFEVVKTYQRIALGVSFIVFLDLGLQVAGFGMPNMDAVIPKSLTAPTMNYIQSLEWRAGISKPNAFFMLEASFTAQFIAVALIIELAFFQRWLWLAGFALALLGTFSGTGLMLVILALPVLARRFWRPLLVYGAVALPLLGGVAVATGWYEIAAKRVTTFDNKSSSAYQRFVGPFVAIHDIVASENEHDIFYGFGAGATAAAEVIPGLEFLEYNAVSKVFVEYGLVAEAVFLLSIIYFFFGTSVPFLIAYVMFLEYNLMGGYFTMPPIINYCYILTAGWALAASRNPNDVR